MTRTRKDDAVNQVATQIADWLKQQPLGSSFVVGQLMNDVCGLNIFESDYLGPDPLKVEDELEDIIADETNLFLDKSHHDGLCEGLPYNLDFILKEYTELQSYDSIQSITLAMDQWIPFSNESMNLTRIGDKVKCVYTHFSSGDFEEPFTEYTLPLEKFIEVINLLKELNALSWTNFYAPVLDGDSFVLQLEDDSFHVKRVTGRNAYPAGFQSLVEVMGFKERVRQGERDDGEIRVIGHKDVTEEEKRNARKWIEEIERTDIE